MTGLIAAQSCEIKEENPFRLTGRSALEPPPAAGQTEIVRRLARKSVTHPLGTPCVHGMLISCVGGVGGVAHGPVVVEKSKNSLMSGMAASRFVRLGKLKRVSISLRTAVKSIGV